jgi:hypothetical protein
MAFICQRAARIDCRLVFGRTYVLGPSLARRAQLLISFRESTIMAMYQLKAQSAKTAKPNTVRAQLSFTTATIRASIA